MAFDWIDYLGFAKHIQDNPDNFSCIPEAAYRAGVSRAYYASFKFTFNIVKKEKFVPSNNGTDHIKIQKYLRESEVNQTNRRKASLQLQRLYEFRRKVDYEDELDMQPVNILKYAIGMADIIVKTLQEEFK